MLHVSVIFAGLLAGTLHVITGPDHLAAVTPLAAASRARSWLAGLWWGIGHSTGTWVLAAIALIFRESFNVDVVSEWSERFVGVVLIAVGLWAFRRTMRGSVHQHVHTHGDVTHSHIHMHAVERHAAHEHHSHGALGIGTLHGLAGTSHLLGILPALALPQRIDGVSYVVAFGVGSIIAMTLFAVLCGWVAASASARSRRAGRAFMLASAAAAVAIGIFWLYDSAAPTHETAPETGAVHARSVMQCFADQA